MFYSYTVMGTSRLSLNIDDEKMNGCLDDLINRLGDTFSYRQLYDSFKYEAISRKWFKKEPYTQYFNIELTRDDARKITMYLWNLIWGKKLMIDFYHDDSRSTDPNNFMFCKI